MEISPPPSLTFQTSLNLLFKSIGSINQLSGYKNHNNLVCREICSIISVLKMIKRNNETGGLCQKHIGLSCVIIKYILIYKKSLK